MAHPLGNCRSECPPPLLRRCALYVRYLNEHRAVVPPCTVLREKLERIASSIGMQMELRPRSLFSGSMEELGEALSRLLGQESVAGQTELLHSMPLAAASLRAVLAVGQVQAALDGIRADDAEGSAAASAAGSAAASLAPGAAPPVVLALAKGELDGIMRLDGSALVALNLMPASAVRRGATDEAQGRSLLASLSAGCWSKGGPRTLARWLTAPLTNAAAISQRADIVEALVNDPETRDRLRDVMRVPDVHMLRRRLARRSANLMDILRLYNTITSPLPAAASLLGAAAPPLVALAERLTWLRGEFAQFVALVETVVDDPTAAEPRIKPTFSPELASAAAAHEDAQGNLMAIADAFMDRHGGGSLDIKFEKDKARGYVFRVTRKHDKAVRKLPGVVICATLQAGVLFTTPRLKAAVDEAQAAQRAFSSAQSAVLGEVLKVVRTYTPIIESLGETLGELDAYTGMAVLACSAPASYVRPVMLPAGDAKGFNIRGARHALLEADPTHPFIPNDHVMQPGSSSFSIITGPNMGGKSTYIRQLGMLVVLAQMGSFVPAASATMPLVDCLLARIGAGDVQLEGVSTFMAEMLEAAAICETVTPASLVIIDELGRGTSTYDGFGLAWALSEHLAAVGAFTLFATHFHEMTALATSMPGVINQHVDTLATGSDITMLYSVRPGPAGASFGVHVARMTGCPPEVVEAAEAKAKELEGLRGAVGGTAEAKEDPSTPAATALDAAARAKAFVAAAATMDGEGMSPAAIAERMRVLIAAHVR